MNVVQCLAHSIESFDMLKLYARIGVDAFDIGGYINPAAPHDPKRPGVPEMPFFPDLKEAVDRIGAPDNLMAAQERLPAELLDWADVIVFHHNLMRLYNQWDRIEKWLAGGSHRRVIARMVGQSVAGNEADLATFRNRGLQVVRYSPKEAAIPNYAGSDALIRFGKNPDEWTGWTGESPVVLNITQHDARPHARDVWVNWQFWEEATKGLPTIFAGPNSEKIGGLGTLPLDDMKATLRGARAYLYLGTQPASYTLGLIEAMMTGVPVVSIGPSHMGIFQPYGPDLFEGHEIATDRANDPRWANASLTRLLHDWPWAVEQSAIARQRAIDLFGIDTIAAQWAAFLGVPVRETVPA